MCGIVGYIGEQKAVPVILEGLGKLEYRGYDSAGLAVYENGGFAVRKYKGRLATLAGHLKNECLNGCLGIGHTRWATHGEPSDANAHPHASSSGDIVVVHNGIIENYMKIKEFLLKNGCVFTSETDTEVLAKYIGYFYCGSLIEAVRKALENIRGSYAFVAVSADEPDKMVCVRKENPLIIGSGKGENFIASDIPAILRHTKDIYLLDENELAVVEKNRVTFYDACGAEVKKELTHITWDAASSEKGGYEHFMLKEIHEQPRVIRDTLAGRISGETEKVSLDGIKLRKEDLERFSRIYIVACGTAYHAGLVGKQIIEKLVRMPVEVHVASEFRYISPLVDDKTLILIVCQSGETLDTLMALKESKKKGARVLSIVNVVGSSVARESHDVLYTRAGPEIAVASTKAYTAQLIAVYEVALFLAELKGTMAAEEISTYKQELMSLPELIEKVLKTEEALKDFVREHCTVRDVFFIGRGLDYPVALEGSLKLKEISYIHSEALPAGELKHGTIALIEEGTVVIALLTQDELFEKMLNNIKEVKARGAFVLAIVKDGLNCGEVQADQVIVIPDVPAPLSPPVAVVPLQILAYYMAIARGCDVDKPRNLAKSVTVE